MKILIQQRAIFIRLFLIICLLSIILGHTLCVAQRELSDSVELPLANATEMKQLKRAAEYSYNQQYQEAIDAIQQIIRSDTNRIHGVSSHQYISLRKFCHLQIAQLPDAGLKLYRKQVDPTVGKLYRQASKTRDKSLLKKIVSHYYCSSYGDDALLTLGEIALEEANFAQARVYWRQLLKKPREKIAADIFNAVQNDEEASEELKKLINQSYRKASSDKNNKAQNQEYRLTSQAKIGLSDRQCSMISRYWVSIGLPLTQLSYPVTDLSDPALSYPDIRARLILASILEKSPQRAKVELQTLKQLYPKATGKLTGRTLNYNVYLRRLLTEAKRWPSPKRSTDWTSFAGNQARNKKTFLDYSLPAIAAIRWRVKLSNPLSVEAADDTARRNIPRRTGESVDALLSYHPILWKDKIFIHGINAQNKNVIKAMDLATGKPIWESPSHTIYKDEDYNWQHAPKKLRLGVPRFTLNIENNLLVSRIGTPVTKRTKQQDDIRKGSRIEILNLAQEASQYRDTITTDDKNWSFEGCPIVKGRYLYVALRRNVIPSRAYLACYDLDRLVPEQNAAGVPLRRANQPQLKWRTFICAADTPAIGQTEECSHNLLSLHDDTLYYNSNLGAVAALSTQQGAIRWLVKYTRSKQSNPEKMVGFWNRDLNPCLYHKGIIFAAPSDTSAIMAIDAASGKIYWDTNQLANRGREPEDVIHVLGTTERHLIVSGDRLYWIDIYTGRVRYRWPEGVSPSVRGYGRGLLVGHDILWPTRDSIYVFAQDKPIMRRQPVRLDIPQGNKLTGGNLFIAGNRLLIATATELVALEIKTSEK